ncbi:arginine repressor [Sphingomonas sp. HDW15A]|uniref:arginine repressor n=1 Tax=Sphingomonas sp. HDW15A TaxID=2714942 RepID=UPI0014076470|nr:arginine repressor [Sphingomonas sp. HDW15A]QIK95461.1 arginine repressor [Sphingomonas sp. HDW15A]
MSAEARRSQLAAIIRAEPVASQEQLSNRLREAGYDVTQATVSRDLEVIGAIRGKKDGQLSYLLPGDTFGDHGQNSLERILGEWGVSVEIAGNLVVMRTRPGSAHVVAAALDAAALDGIAGTIAGDDTLFIAVRDGHDPSLLARILKPR